MNIIEIAKILEDLRIQREIQEEKRQQLEVERIRDEEEYYRELAYGLDY